MEPGLLQEVLKKAAVTGRVACKQMMPMDERRSIGGGKREREGKI